MAGFDSQFPLARPLLQWLAATSLATSLFLVFLYIRQLPIAQGLATCASKSQGIRRLLRRGGPIPAGPVRFAGLSGNGLIRALLELIRG